MILKSPGNQKEFDQYYKLRWEILRKPLGGEKGTEIDELEEESFHLMIKNNKSITVAVGRIHFVYEVNDMKAQIRYMAVSSDYQGMGYGNILIKGLEKIAKKNEIKNIFLHAREGVIEFYKKNGYKIEKKSHLLLNQIQHWLMSKNI